MKNKTYTVGALFTNSSLQTGFWWKEFGVYALDPDEGEILYCYSTAGDAGDYIPVASSQRIEKYIYMSIGVGNANNVTITVNQTDSYVTLTDFKSEMALKADLGTDGKVLSEQLPEISSSAEDITITDTAENFTSDNVEGALAECFQYANNGKTAIGNAISGKGVTVSLEDTFTLLASKITAQMCKFGGTATVTDVLSGKTFINNSGEILTGTMANQGAKSASLNAGGSYTIPEGYHNGSGVISANSLASQTDGTATSGNILSGYAAWVGGVKITGTMPNIGAVTQTLTTQGGQYIIPAGYHNGSGKVTANISNLIAENIKEGVNVGGVVGTLEIPKFYERIINLTSEENIALPTYGNDFKRILTIDNLPFTPNKIEYAIKQIPVYLTQYHYQMYACYDSDFSFKGFSFGVEERDSQTMDNLFRYVASRNVTYYRDTNGLVPNNASYVIGVKSIGTNSCEIVIYTDTRKPSIIEFRCYKR